jgi:hypothetical protein
VHNITIRPAKMADLGSLRELYRQLNPDDPPWPSKAAARHALAGVLGQAATTIFICDVDGTCVGTCMLVVCPNFTRCGRPFALIENVVTHQHHRQAGLRSKGRSTRHGGRPPTGMLPGKSNDRVSKTRDAAVL